MDQQPSNSYRDPQSTPTRAAQVLRVLLADDNALYLRSVGRLVELNRPSWGLEMVEDPDEALVAIFENRHDVVLLDWSFKKALSGPELCRRARAGGATVPIVMLTVAEEVEQRVEALDAGADEYLVKDTVSPLELCRRVEVAFLRAQKRRTPVPQDPTQSVRIGPLLIDLTGQTVFVHGHLVSLRNNERRILMALARSPGEVVPHETLCSMSEVRPGRAYCNLHNQIARLRKNLGRGAAGHIDAVRGSGYRLRRG